MERGSGDSAVGSLACAAVSPPISLRRTLTQIDGRSTPARTIRDPVPNPSSDAHDHHPLNSNSSNNSLLPPPPPPLLQRGHPYSPPKQRKIARARIRP